MKMTKLATGFVGFTIKMFSYTTIYVYLTRLFRKKPKQPRNSTILTEEEKNNLFLKINNYYRIHGIYCSDCNTYVPRESKCKNCGKIFTNYKPKKLLPGTTVRKY